MRALVFDGNCVRFDPQREAPVASNGQALIRPLLAGICATDIQITRGYMDFTGVLGHEFVGVVEQVGPGADPAAQSLIGRRVVGGINCVCGRCDMCTGGLSGHCRHRTVLGIHARDGCFADRFLLPVQNLIPVPDVLSDERAVFAEPVAAACQILHQLRVEGHPFVTVLGDGRLGLLVAQVLSRLNASVRIAGKHTEKLDICEKWGIKHRHIADIPPRADQDIVVDCSGSADGLALAMQMVRPRGQIVMKTTVAGSSSIDLSPLVIHEIRLIGSRCGPLNDALEMLTTDQIDVISLISRTMKITDGVNALNVANQPLVLKVLLEFD